jgi:hypothetical protein
LTAVFKAPLGRELARRGELRLASVYDAWGAVKSLAAMPTGSQAAFLLLSERCRERVAIEPELTQLGVRARSRPNSAGGKALPPVEH